MPLRLCVVYLRCAMAQIKCDESVSSVSKKCDVAMLCVLGVFAVQPCDEP